MSNDRPRAVPPGGGRERAGPHEPAGRDEWAGRFDQQADACAELGSPLYGRLLHLIADELRAGSSTWDVVGARADLRFGQAGPLRLVGAAHRMALAGEDPGWAAVLPSCGGVVPSDDAALLVSWRALVERRAERLAASLDAEVQTNEVARASALALALAQTRFTEARLVELGCSGALNLRLDRFAIDVAGTVLGDPTSSVRLTPAATEPSRFAGRNAASHGAGARRPVRDRPVLRHGGWVLPRVIDRVGIDPHPVDVGTEEGRLRLLSFVWPDQAERLGRVAAAIDIAATQPAELLRASDTGDGDTADVLESVVERGGPIAVQHSIVWQYVPTDVRWRITEVMERAGADATAAEPLAWIRYEPDEWDRRRAAVWLRTWPHGGDRLVAHADFHGRWVVVA